MNKATNKLIPELRFPEFENGGEWVEKVLESYCLNLSSGKDKNTPDGKYELYGSTGIIGKSEEASYEGDFILVARVGANAGQLNRVKGKFGVTDNTLVINLKKTEIIDFIFYFLERFGLNKLVFGSGQPLITGGQLKDLIIVTSNPNEQKKIASCLSSLDEVIAAHSQKLEALKDHKRGLMQNLFPQEGETVPKLRFPEFVKDGEWVEKELGDVADFINGKAYNQEELLSKGKYRVLRVGNFFTNKEWYYSDLELDDDKYCENGDLLYAWSASFGPHIWTEEKVIYHYHIWKVKNKKGINRQYLFNLLDYETFRIKSKSLNGFALMHITKGTIENWESIIPKSEKEQQKIASCLSSLDKLITAQAEKIEQLKLHKKGLMQGLFPKIK